MNNLLIERLQNFTLDRKIFSVDSDDRDITRHPNPSCFEISCPQDYTNIESIRLVNIQTINKFYNISEYLQNNKLICEFNDTQQTIKLEDGFYEAETLRNALLNALTNIDSTFNVSYSNITQKFEFNCNQSFSFIFNEKPDFSNNCQTKMGDYVDIYNQNNKWGLGSILGFNNKNQGKKNTN